MSEQIRWGILGCGDVTEVKSGPALQKAPRSTVTAVMRRDAAKAEDYARRHGVARWHSDAQALIEDETVDAVYIATPPDSHAAYALAAMKAGKPVLVEKPMGLTTAECAAMTEASRATGQSLTVAFYRRALPRFEALRAYVQSGAIGAPRLVEVRHFLTGADRPGVAWKIDPSVGGGGFFMDMQSHALDWLGYVFGPPTAVRGLAKRQGGAYPAEDLVTYLMDFGPLPAVGLCAYATDRKEEQVIIHGSEGSAAMGFFRPSAITLTRGGTAEEIDRPDPPHVHQPFVERVTAHLLDGAPNPCGPEEGARVNRLLEQIYAGL